MKGLEDVRWLGHAGFSFTDKETGNKVYYVDPFKLPNPNGLERADLVFITHAHYDHLSPDDINLLLKPETTVVATPDSLKTLNITQEKFPVEQNNSYEIKGFKFDTVPAYNVKPERLKFHPKKNNWVGYIFRLNGLKIYHAGDTDFIPEMQEFPKFELDFAMIPMGGTYTMDVDEAIEAANAISAKVSIPMHYKSMLGDRSKEAEEKFKNGVTNSRVMILKELS